VFLAAFIVHQSFTLLLQIRLIFYGRNWTGVLKSANSMELSIGQQSGGTYLPLSHSITSFGDRPNDYETVVQYFRAHFLQVHRRNNENRRVLYTHFTSVVVRLNLALRFA